MKTLAAHITYAPQHQPLVIQVIGKLKTRSPHITFNGRHIIGFNALASDVSSSIASSRITIVLAGMGTFESTFVKSDIEESLSKEPPNQILVINLENCEPLGDSAVGKVIGALGCEEVNLDDDTQQAIERAAIAVHHREVVIQSATHDSAGGCGR